MLGRFKQSFSGATLLAALFVFSLIEAPAVLAQAPAAEGPTTGRRSVRPTRTSTPPRIDGRLDDEVWRTAVKLTEFTQQSPLDGAPASEPTEVYIAYDDDHIYFGFHAIYSDPSIMRANRVDRDRAAQDDLFTVYFDTFQDQQRGYDFDVNAYGVQGDGIISASGPGGAIPRADRSWNALFRSGGQIVEDGFTAEMAIPFKSLRYPGRAEGEEHRWGFQIVREIKGKDQENIVWAPMSRGEASFFAQMGVLEGMTNLSTSRNLEILPTVTAIQYGSIRPEAARFVNDKTDPDAGVNLKYGITSNLTADFTINPDFSQIESDGARIEVNQRFPIFFSELRPFFVEGAEIFSLGGPVTLVHTRTIVDPDWGAKLSGKMGNLSVGFVTTNDRAPGNIPDETNPAFERAAYTLIGRARYDLYSESNLGAIFTDREFLDSYSRLGGVDGNFRLSPTISTDFQAIGTSYRNQAGEGREGHILDFGIRQNGRSLDWSLGAHQISPDFATNVGFVRRVDERVLSSSAGYTFYPETWLLNWGPDVNYSRNYNFDGTLQDESLGSVLAFSFARNISALFGVDREMERFRDVDFRKTRFSGNLNVSTSRRFTFNASYNRGDQVRYIAEPFLGFGSGWGFNATVRPVPRLESRLTVNASRLTDPRNNDEEVFDVKIFRGFTTYQFTDRISMRNITEYDTLNDTMGFNLLLNYRVNAGTVFYVGYDDHYQNAEFIDGYTEDGLFDERLFFSEDLQRTGRAIFVKLQYLLRY